MKSPHARLAFNHGHEGRKIVLGDEAAVRSLPGLVLHLLGTSVADVAQGHELLVPLVGPSVRERPVVQPPESAELAQHRQRPVHEVLVCAAQAGFNIQCRSPSFAENTISVYPAVSSESFGGL